jgi:addiction module RelE/StbE family toxin
VRIEWSPLALRDRQSIFEYIEADNPLAAVRMDERVRSRIELLPGFPLMGRVGRVEGTRELVIVGTPYIAAYSVDAERILVLRLLHGARMWPDRMEAVE